VENKDYLSHHGIKGQKRGVRRGPPYPLGTSQKSSSEKKKLPKYGGKNIRGPLSYSKDKNAWLAFNNGDYIIKKGSIYERATTNPNEKFKNRMYVSENGRSYVEQLFDSGCGYVDVYKLDRDAVIAGRETIVDILNSLNTKQSKKIAKRMAHVPTKKNIDSMLYNPFDDFLMSNFLYRKTAKNFINELRNRGYDGIPDPLDSGFRDSVSFDATIFVNNILSKEYQYEYDGIPWN
jgi:hypothetical protein